MNEIEKKLPKDHIQFSKTSICFNRSIKLLHEENIVPTECISDIVKYCSIDNIRDLDDKSAENVTHFIKYRFAKNSIYTWAGQTLIAVHPFCENYSSKFQKENLPNISSVVSRAWFQLSHKLGKINQCIVISGDSGSGKTYSGCVAMRYLATQEEACDSDVDDNILLKAWSSVPVLTAFGNASTMHNSNSSRFGKLTQMQCCNGKIVGAFIQTYLLERSRVSGPNDGETNFHIFNQVIEHASENTLNNIYLSKNINYKIAPKSPKHTKKSLTETVKAMQSLNIIEIRDIMKILSLILNLGNIEFVDLEEKHSISEDSKKFVENCSFILICDYSTLSRLFVKRLLAAKLRRGTICYTTCLNIEECQERRNSLMRFLYDRLFTWLVKRINDQICRGGEHDLLGILDIYGFETFTCNTFEQLCINYANERLQQYFTNDYYTKQQIYLNEKYERINHEYDISKYDDRIKLLDGTPSVFGILNEECLIKRYNTDIFIGTRLSNALKDLHGFIARPNNRSTKFSIRHYAGIVEYDCKSMVNKNRDKVPEEIISFLEGSQFKFLLEILGTPKIECGSGGKTILTKFKTSLDNLMKILNKADTHYVKCLKPNIQQIPGYFDKKFFIQQLIYNGIMEILHLEFQSYSTVISKQEFSEKFNLETLKILENRLGDYIFIGNDKIYFKENGFKIVLMYKNFITTNAVRRIQKFWKKCNRKRNLGSTEIQTDFKTAMDSPFQSEDSSFSIEPDEPEITVIESKKSQCDVVLDREPIFMDTLETLSQHVLLKQFRRTYFSGNHIVSKQRLAQVPIRFHLKKSCVPFSHLLPISEVPQGLYDLFQD